MRRRRFDTKAHTALGHIAQASLKCSRHPKLIRLYRSWQHQVNIWCYLFYTCSGSFPVSRGLEKQEALVGYLQRHRTSPSPRCVLSGCCPRPGVPKPSDAPSHLPSGWKPAAAAPEPPAPSSGPLLRTAPSSSPLAQGQVPGHTAPHTAAGRAALPGSQAAATEQGLGLEPALPTPAL